MKHDNVKFVLTFILAVFTSTLINAAASGTLFDSNEVAYDNSQSGLNSANVQGAVDELYAAATDYSNISSRVTNLENKWGTNSSYFASSGLQILGGSNIDDRGLFVNDNNRKRRAGFYYNETNGRTYITSYDSSGEWGNFGGLSVHADDIVFQANSVKIGNSYVLTDTAKTAFTVTPKVGTFSTNSCYRVGAMRICNLWVTGLNATNFPANTEVTIGTLPSQDVPAGGYAWGAIGYLGSGISEHMYYKISGQNLIASHHNGTVTGLLINAVWVV